VENISRQVLSSVILNLFDFYEFLIVFDFSTLVIQKSKVWFLYVFRLFLTVFVAFLTVLKSNFDFAL